MIMSVEQVDHDSGGGNAAQDAGVTS